MLKPTVPLKILQLFKGPVSGFMQNPTNFVLEVYNFLYYILKIPS